MWQKSRVLLFKMETIKNLIKKLRRKQEPVNKYIGNYEAELYFHTGVIRVDLDFAKMLEEVGEENVRVAPKKDAGGIYGMKFPNDPENYELIIWKGKENISLICENREYLDLIKSRLTRLPKDYSLSTTGLAMIR